MAAIDDGGPAFPAHSEEDVGDGFFAYTYPGMTLRDYFAAQAMVQITVGACVGDKAFYAQEAYKMADAMLRASKERP